MAAKKKKREDQIWIWAHPPLWTLLKSQEKVLTCRLFRSVHLWRERQMGHARHQLRDDRRDIKRWGGLVLPNEQCAWDRNDAEGPDGDREARGVGRTNEPEPTNPAGTKRELHQSFHAHMRRCWRMERGRRVSVKIRMIGAYLAQRQIDEWAMAKLRSTITTTTRLRVKHEAWTTSICWIEGEGNRFRLRFVFFFGMVRFEV